jgi:hypothetical protein
VRSLRVSSGADWTRWLEPLREQPLQELAFALGPSSPPEEVLQTLRSCAAQWPLEELTLERLSFQPETVYGGDEPLLDPLLASPVMAGVRHLHVGLLLIDRVPDLMATLARNPSRGALQSLAWNACALHSPSLAALLSSEPCQTLRRLSLASGHRRADGPLEPVLRAVPASLRALSLARGTPEELLALEPLALEELELRVLLSAPELGRLLADRGTLLRRLSLPRPLDRAHLQALHPLDGLRALALPGAGLEGELFFELLRLPWLGQLEELDLSNNRDLLADPDPLLPALGRLRRLRARRTGLEGRGLRRLAESGALLEVEELELSLVDEEAMAALASNAPALRSLRLEACSAAAWREMGRGSLCPQLRELHLERSPLTDEASEVLASLPLSRLRRFRCERTASPQGWLHLEGAPWFAGLERGRSPLDSPVQAR